MSFTRIYADLRGLGLYADWGLRGFALIYADGSIAAWSDSSEIWITLGLTKYRHASVHTSSPGADLCCATPAAVSVRMKCRTLPSAREDRVKTTEERPGRARPAARLPVADRKNGSSARGMLEWADRVDECSPRRSARNLKGPIRASPRRSA